MAGAVAGGGGGGGAVAAAAVYIYFIELTIICLVEFCEWPVGKVDED